MSRKLIKASFFTFLLVVTGFIVYVTFISMSMTGTVLGMNGENFIALNAQSAKARVTNPNKNSSLYYQFTTNQRTHLMNRIQKNNGAAIQATVKILGKHNDFSEKKPFEFGFLYDKDGEIATGNNSVKGDFSRVLNKGNDAVAVSICIPDTSNLPIGFFVHGMLPYELAEIRFVDMKIGWDKSSAINLYAFGVNGGDITAVSDRALVTAEGAKLFSKENDFPFPKIVIGLKSAQTIGTLENQDAINFYYGKEKFKVRRSYSQKTVTFQLAGMKSPYSKMEFADPSEIVSAMLVGNEKSLNADKRGRVYYPLVTDLGMIVDWPQDKWRTSDYELFEWEEIPSVLFFDFKNYEVQNEFLTRLAYFVEKAGYKGTFVSDEFIRTHHGYNAHDYKADDLARFFSQAVLTDFHLNKRELLLREVTLECQRCTLDEIEVILGRTLRNAAFFAIGNFHCSAVDNERKGFVRGVLRKHRECRVIVGLNLLDVFVRDKLRYVIVLHQDYDVVEHRTSNESRVTDLVRTEDGFIVNNFHMIANLEFQIATLL